MAISDLQQGAANNRRPFPSARRTAYEAGRRGQEPLSPRPSGGGGADLLDDLAEDVLRRPVPRERRFWVISGCAGLSAARQVNLNKRTQPREPGRA
jgi:hypothetical protein